MKNTKTSMQKRRHARIRARMTGTTARPRLVVFRSLTKNYAQLVDDTTGKVIVTACDPTKKSQRDPLGTGNKTERAKIVGLEIAKKAMEKGIKSCVFDRNGYKYHGRVKALADGAREGGLKF